MLKSSLLLLITSLPVVLLAAGCEVAWQPTPQTGGTYPPVTEEQLRKARFSHRTGGEKFEFDWRFDGNRFAIEGKTIPPDLVTAMLGPDVSADRIQGTWQIRDDIIELAIDGEGDSGSAKTCLLPIYFTGVIRIETPEAQYVF